MIKRLVRVAKKAKKPARAKSSGPRTKRAPAKLKPIDSGTAVAESIFLMYGAREAADAKSKA